MLTYADIQVSAMRRSSFNLICFFMVTNLLIIPGLALNGLDALWTATIGMLTYADVGMLTYADVGMLTYADVC